MVLAGEAVVSGEILNWIQDPDLIDAHLNHDRLLMFDSRKPATVLLPNAGRHR